MNQHQASDAITEYRVEEATLDAAAAMLDRIRREGYEEIALLPTEAMELIRQAVRVTIGEQA